MIKNESYINIQGWMINELQLSGTELLVYAIIYGFSQDNETKFEGSRQYLADWCNCSVRNIQNILNSLTERGLLTKYEDTKNGIKFCKYVANFTTSEKISLASEKSSLNNITNNIDNSNISISKDIDIPAEQTEYESHMYSKDDFLGSYRKKPKKNNQSLYDKCILENMIFTKNIAVLKYLDDYLKIRLQMKDKPLYGVNQWKGLLNKLYTVSGGDAGAQVEIISTSIERGWASFFDPHKSNIVEADDGLSCEQSTDSIEERISILERNGRRAEF